MTMNRRKGDPANDQPFEMSDAMEELYASIARPRLTERDDPAGRSWPPGASGRSYSSRVSAVRAMLDKYFSEIIDDASELVQGRERDRGAASGDRERIAASERAAVAAGRRSGAPPDYLRIPTPAAAAPRPPLSPTKPVPPAARTGDRLRQRAESPSVPTGVAYLRRALTMERPQEALCAALYSLPTEALLLLRLLTETSAATSLALVSEEARRLLGSQSAQRAVLLLCERGLVFRGSLDQVVFLPHDLLAPLRELLPPLCVPRAMDADASPVHESAALAQTRRTPLELAALTLALWTVRPRMTNNGQIYRRDEERLRALLGAEFPLNARLDQLQGLGLLGGGETLTVSQEAAERLARLRPVDLLLHEALRRFNSGPRLRALAVLLRACRDNPESAWVPQLALERELRLGYLKGPALVQGPAHLNQLGERDMQELAVFGGLERRTCGRHDYFRVWPPLAGHAEAAPASAPAPRVHLQPSFEILVPPDAPIATILALGRVAELRRFDQVLTLQLTRAAVVQAVEQGMQAADILLLLSGAAHAGVPQNVQASITGWADQAGQARFAEGLVLVLREDSEPFWRDDQALRTLLGRQLARGVFLVPTANRAAVDKRLRALGVQVSGEVLRGEAPLEAGPPPGPATWERFAEDLMNREPPPPPPSDPQAQRLRERIGTTREILERYPLLSRPNSGPEPFLLTLSPPIRM